MLAQSGGPFLFGARTMANAMYAPVVTRFMTYDVKLDARLAAYARTIMAMPEMVEWIEAAKAEPADIEELEVEYQAARGASCPFEGLKLRAGLLKPVSSVIRGWRAFAAEPASIGKSSGVIGSLAQALRRIFGGGGPYCRSAARLARNSHSSHSVNATMRRCRTMFVVAVAKHRGGFQ